MEFVKMQGLGNDYIYIETFTKKFPDIDKISFVKTFSDRHFGIGGDGVIFVNPSDVADCEMEMYNMDGSRGEMCGNGIRCVGKLLFDKGLTDKTDILVTSCGSIKKLKMKAVTEEKNSFTGLLYGERSDGRVIESVTVDMGKPVLKPSEIPMDINKTGVIITDDIKQETQNICLMRGLKAGNMEYEMTCVSMGNPHAVIYVKDVDGYPVCEEGPLIENHACFPNKVNIEFIEVIDRANIRMRVWERGSGETLACGTGACAAAVSSILNGFTEDSVIVHLRGGDLLITWDRKEDRVCMTGKAVTVFKGVI